MALVYALIGSVIKPSLGKESQLLRGNLGSSIDDETGCVHWKSIPTLGAVQRSALDVSGIRDPGGIILQSEKMFLHDSEF